MQIKWSKISQKDLHNIIYLTKEEWGNTSTENIIITILKIVEKIASFPALGKVGFREGTREFFIPKTPYILIYKTEENAIIILRIFHTKRFRFIHR